MKCENCDDEATFVVKNLRKDDTLCFCDIHFWKFCSGMMESLKQFKGAVKEIDVLLSKDGL